MKVSEALESARETKIYEARPGALSLVPEILRRDFPGEAAVLVADDNTYAAAGERLRSEIERAGVALSRVIRYPSTPVLHATYELVERLREELRGAPGVPVAVGGGTINDIVKRASWELGRKYLCVATAASVDGYTSFGAAIVKDGFKQTLECDAPYASIGDTNVLTHAPVAMNAAGYGDLVAKIFGGADWIVADELAISPVHPLAWRMVQEELRSWVSKPDGIPHADPAAIGVLFSGLAVTGFAMQAIRDSRPASGGEHLLSHVWEMEGLEHEGTIVSHGFKVAIGSLGSCALYELFLELDIEKLDLDACVAAWPSWDARERSIRSRVGSTPYVEQMVAQSKKKYVDAATLRRRLHLLRERWEPLTSRLRSQLFSYRETKELFRRAGCPVRPEEVGLTRDHAVATFDLAQMMRERYTLLDAAVELGLLEEWKSRIRDSDSYWR